MVVNYMLFLAWTSVTINSFNGWKYIQWKLFFKWIQDILYIQYTICFFVLKRMLDLRYIFRRKIFTFMACTFNKICLKWVEESFTDIILVGNILFTSSARPSASLLTPSLDSKRKRKVCTKTYLRSV